MHKAQAALIAAYDRGYRVMPDGTVLSPNGVTRKTTKTKDGYSRFTFKFEGESYPIRVHRLCAYQRYQGRLFDPGIVVRHLNGNPADNRPDNIDIGTQSENMFDRSPDERANHARQASPTKLKPDDIFNIRRSHESLRAWSRQLGVSKSTVSYARRGITHAHL